MANILKVDNPLGGTIRAAGYLPTIGASGYSRRHAAEDFGLPAGSSLPTAATWSNRVRFTSLSMYQASGTTTTPKIETLPGPSGFLGVGCPTGSAIGFTGPREPVADRTIAFVCGGASITTSAGARAVVNSLGFQVWGTQDGWKITSKDVGSTWTTRLSLVDTTVEPENGSLYVVLFSASKAGNLRLRAKRDNSAVSTVTANGVTRGTDTQLRIGNNVDFPSTNPSLPVGRLVVWDRVLTVAEEDAAIAGLSDNAPVVEPEPAVVYATDTFDRADGALTTTEDGKTYTVARGTWNVVSNKAQAPTISNPGKGAVALIDAGTNVVDAQVTVGGGTWGVGLALRYAADQSTGYNVVTNTSDYRIQWFDATAAPTTIATFPKTVAEGQVLRCTINGSGLFSVYVDGALLGTHTDTRFTGNFHGLLSQSTARTVDSFTLKSLT